MALPTQCQLADRHSEQLASKHSGVCSSKSTTYFPQELVVTKTELKGELKIVDFNYQGDINMTPQEC